MDGLKPVLIYAVVATGAAFSLALLAPLLGYPVTLPTSERSPAEAAALFAAFSLVGLVPAGLFIQTVTGIADALRSPRWATILLAGGSAWLVTLIALAFGGWIVGITEAGVVFLATTAGAVVAARVFPNPPIS